MIEKNPFDDYTKECDRCKTHDSRLWGFRDSKSYCHRCFNIVEAWATIYSYAFDGADLISRTEEVEESAEIIKRELSL